MIDRYIYSMYVCLKRQLDLLDCIDLIDCSLCIAIEIIFNLLPIIKISPRNRLVDALPSGERLTKVNALSITFSLCFD